MAEPPPSPPPGGPPPAWDQLAGRPSSASGPPPGAPPFDAPPVAAPPPGGPPGGPPAGPGRRRGLVIGLAVLAVIAVAGGAYLVTQDDEGAGSGDLPPMPDLSAEEREYVDAFAELVEDSGVAGDHADCFGVALLEGIGIDTLRDAAPADEIADGEATSLREFGIALDGSGVEQVTQRLTQCGDLVETVIDASDAPNSAQDCLRENLTEELWARYVAADYAGNLEVADAAEDEFFETIDPCRDAPAD